MEHSVILAQKSVGSSNKTQKQSVFNYAYDKGSYLCGCADCKKTFKTSRYSYSDRACPDCGGKELDSQVVDTELPIDTTIKTPARKRVGVMRTQSAEVVKNDDGSINKSTAIYEYDLFTIYPSNRMHAQRVRQTITADLENGTIQSSYIDITDDEHHKPMGMYDEDSSFENGVSSYLSAGQQDENSIRKYHSKGGYERSIVPFMSGPNSCYENEASEKMATEIVKSFGIDAQRDYVKGSYSLNHNIARMDFLVRYPGLRDMVLNKVNENLLYAKDENGNPISEEEKIDRRTQEVDAYVTQMTNVDYKLLEDLRKCKTADDADHYLRKVTFGKNADGSVVEDSFISRVKIDDSSFDGYGFGKKLRKNFNKNPLGTANFVYTAIGKIGFRDVNHLYQMMDRMEESKEEDRGRYYRRETPFEHNTIKPLRMKDEIRFIKAYAKSHTPGQTVKDWYMNDENYSVFKDCANMYGDMCKAGFVCSTQEECDIASVNDAKRKVKDMLDEGVSKDEILDAVSPYWAPGGGNIEPAKQMLDKVIEDIQTNGVEERIEFYGRDGKPILANRNPQEIHDELSEKNSVVAGLTEGNKKSVYTAKDREIWDKDIGDFKFRLPKSTYELIRTGEQMQICVGGAGYREYITTQSSHNIVVMMDKSNQKVGCIELDGKEIRQFKSPRNHAITDERCGEGAVDAAKAYIEQLELRGDYCSDVRHFTDPTYAPYGDRDFTAEHLPANPYPPLRIMAKYYKGEMEKSPRKLPSTPAVEQEVQEGQFGVN